MPKKQARDLLAKLLPHLRSLKQRLALFTVMLLLALAPMDFDSVHMHVKPEPTMPSVTVQWSASGNVTPTISTFSLPWK